MEAAETRKCPDCQYILSPAAKFCPSCGRQVSFDENSEIISGLNRQEAIMTENGADAIEEKSAVISFKNIDKELKNPFLFSKDDVLNKILNPELKPLPTKKKFLFREWKAKNEDVQKVNDKSSCNEVMIEGIHVTAKEKTLEESHNENAGFLEEENSVEVMKDSSQKQERDFEGLETDEVSSIELAKEIPIDETAIKAKAPLDNYHAAFDGLKAEIDDNDELNADKKLDQYADVIATEASTEEIEGSLQNDLSDRDMGDEVIDVQWIPHRNEQLKNEELVVPIDETVEESKKEQIDALENAEIEMMGNGSQDFIEVEGKSIELVPEEGMDLNDLKALLDFDLNENNPEAEREKTEIAEESIPIIETLSDESGEVGLSSVILRESELFEEETVPDKEERVIEETSLKKTEEQISEVQETVETEYTERLPDDMEKSELEEVRTVDSDKLESAFQKEEKPIEIDSAASSIFPEIPEESAYHEQSEENDQMPNDLFEIIQSNIEDQVEATIAQEKTIQPNRIITSSVSRGFGRQEQEEAKKVSKMNLLFNKRRR